MVFVPPTSIDNQNASIYAFERKKLASFNHFLKTSPHIFSHVHVEIRFNTEIKNQSIDEFDKNIYVRLIGTREFCKQVHCNAYFPRGETCKVNSKPFVFKSGNSDIEACHASCYKLYNGAKDENGQHYKAPSTAFSSRQKCCLLRLDNAIRRGFDDYVRTDIHPTPRVDTIGTGFDLKNEPYIDKSGNETFKFQINQFYCDDFMLTLKNNFECDENNLEKVLGVLTSDNLLKSLQYGKRKITTGIGFSSVQKPKLAQIKKKAPMSYIEWKSNVNKDASFFNVDLLLSDFGITFENKHLFFTTQYGWPGHIVEPILMYKNISNLKTKKINFSKEKLGKLPQFQTYANGRRTNDEFELLGYHKLITDINNLDKVSVEDINSDFIPKVEASLKILLDFITSTETSINVISYFLPQYIQILKKITLYAEETLGKVTKTTINLAQNTIFSNLAISTGTFMKHFSKMGFKLASSSFKILSVLGIISDVLGFIDLFLIGSDLFNYKYLMNQDSIDYYSIYDILAKESIFGYGSVEYSPALFITLYNSFNSEFEVFDIENTNSTKISDNVSLLLNAHTQTQKYFTTVEKIKHKDDFLEVFKWQSEFLLNLKKNSNGETINWSEENKLENFEFNERLDNVFENRQQNFQIYKNYTKKIEKKFFIVLFMFSITIILAFLNWLCFPSNVFLLISTFFAAIFTFSFTFIRMPNE